MRRLMSPSPATTQLAEIAYHVAYHNTKSHSSADTKKSKWLTIPAFLVTVVHANQQAHDHDDVIHEADAATATSSPYDPRPFVPPATERQLEDYAAACAAVQNCLVSLHAEEIANKWATGPVIHTPAFRKLIGAHPTDRVVALVMVGGLTSRSTSASVSSSSSSSSSTRNEKTRRRRRRSLEDILQDVHEA
jgi:hypothetical protein